MNKLKWNAGQIVNDTNEYELAQYPATDKPKYLIDYDFKDMEIARLNKIIDKIKKLRNANTHVENIYYAEGVLLNEPYCDIEDVDNEELLDILRGDE